MEKPSQDNAERVVPEPDAWARRLDEPAPHQSACQAESAGSDLVPGDQISGLLQQHQELQNELQKLETGPGDRLDTSRRIEARLQALESELARVEDQQQAWQETRRQQEEELRERTRTLLQEQRELAAAREKLRADREAFNRFLTIEQTQLQVMQNLNRLQFEKSPVRNLWSRLLKPLLEDVAGISPRPEAGISPNQQSGEVPDHRPATVSSPPSGESAPGGFDSRPRATSPDEAKSPFEKPAG